jgi:hypothetical protein
MGNLGQSPQAESDAAKRYQTLIDQLSALQKSYKAAPDQADQARNVENAIAIASELIPNGSNYYYLELQNRLSGDTIPTITLYAEYKQDVPVLDVNQQLQCVTSTPPTPATCVPPTTGMTALSSPKVIDLPIVQDTLPQVHALSSFNVDAGVVYNTTKTKSYGFSSTTGTPVTTGSTPTVDPVLFLMWYPQAIDAESPTNCFKGDFEQCYKELALSLGLSMAAPTSNFYVGSALEP